MSSRAAGVIGAKRTIPLPQIYILPGLPGSLIRTAERCRSCRRAMISSPNSGKTPCRQASAAKSAVDAEVIVIARAQDTDALVCGECHGLLDALKRGKIGGKMDVGIRLGSRAGEIRLEGAFLEFLRRAQAAQSFAMRSECSSLITGQIYISADQVASPVHAQTPEAKRCLRAAR